MYASKAVRAAVSAPTPSAAETLRLSGGPTASAGAAPVGTVAFGSEVALVAALVVLLLFVSSSLVSAVNEVYQQRRGKSPSDGQGVDGTSSHLDGRGEDKQ